MNVSFMRQGLAGVALWGALAVLALPGTARAAVQLGESMDSGLAAAYTTGDQTLTSGVWNTVSVYKEAAAASYAGTGAAARINDDTSGACIRTPVLNTAGSITFWYRELNSGGGTFRLQKSYDAASWVDVASQAFSGTTFVQYSNQVNDSAATIYLRVLNDNQAGHLIVDEFEITTYEAASSAPEFDANPGPLSATVGVATAFAVGATGSPEPVLALDSTTASGGYSFTAGTGELSYTPATNDVGAQTFTFTASNGVGVATQVVGVTVGTAPESAPVFNANPGPVGATSGVAVAFTVSANGNPVPALALDSTTATGDSYLFESATGYCVYDPPANDVGAQTFTFTASNTQGTAMQTVTVNVAAAPVYVSTVAVTNLGSNSFTINWTAVTDATNYQVQVATDTNFSPGASGGDLIISEVADPYDNANARFVELYNASGAAIDFGAATWTLGRQANGSTWASIPLTGTLATGATYVIAYNQSTYESVFGDAADLYSASVSGNGDDGYFLFSGGDYSSGTLVDAYGVVGQDGSGYDWEYTDSHAVRNSSVTMPTSTWTSSEWTITGDYASNMTPHAHAATAGGGGEGGTLVVDETVAGLATNVSGLDMETTYYVRVRAAPTGTWSTIVLATTTGGEPTPPSFTGGAGPYDVTAGVLLDFTVSAMGTPVPALALEAATPSTNDYAFEPSTGYFLYQSQLSDGGTVQTFTFTASNTEGVATQVVTVNVTAASAPAFGPNPGPLTATTGVAQSFTVSATGTPDPELALQSTTASGGTYSFTAGTGLLGYTPPTNDLGAQTFTFTASNLAGVATQVVSVAVSNAPALPTIDPLVSLHIEVGQTSNVWVVARETDGDALALTASNLPANAAFAGATGTVAVSNLFTFSPASNQAGQAYTVYFFASDVNGTTSIALNVTVASDDPWADYYASCYTNGVLKTGDDLKDALHDIIDGHTYIAYGSQTDSILEDIDECPTNSSMVQCLYLQHGLSKSDGSWNKEHVWAQSHGIDGAAPAYSDVHHLHPTLIQANSDRNSRDFDIVSGTTTNYDYDGAGTAGNFEPPLAGKGDVARAMFYMAVRYDGTDAVGDLELTNATPTSTESALFGKLDTLLDWNELDEVNDFEIRRNNLIYANYQHNRNPFVDHPEWARVVFDTNYLALPTLTAFSAAANGADQIDLSFSCTGTGAGAIIVWNTDGNFGAPSGTAPAVGQSFAGGTVLYKGTSSPQSHAGLSSCQTVHYKCWAYAGTNYSAAGMTDNATTAGPDAPASVWTSATNATDFTAAWSGVAGVAEYQLQVATGPGFTGSGDDWSTIFRETMGESIGTTLLDDHEAADGFDNDAFTMSAGGADASADIRTSSGSGGYMDPAGNLASSNANVYFTATGVTNLGFAIEGIDSTGYEALALSFGYRKENAASNMMLGVEWSTNGGGAWNAVAVSNLPAADAAIGWYMVSNLTVSTAALGSTNLSLRWTKNGGVAGRIDDVLLQGYLSESLFVPGYSNRTVSGATSAAVTGLTGGVTYYFRLASLPNCAAQYSPLGGVTTLLTLAAPSFGANPGPFAATAGVAVAFAVSASGSPTPVLALADTTASGGYSFDPGTGQLDYAPPLADVGARSFTFTASNTQGVATQIVAVTVSDWPAAAPVFTSGTSFGATTGVAAAFAVAATGYPAPVLALAAATASGGYGFTPATGQLTYVPPEADAGSPTFTFTASNASGVATQVVAAVVAAGVPSAPASLWASATNATGFTAAWSASVLATGYRLDVSTEADFQVTGGASVQTVLASNAATDASLIAGDWSGTDLAGTNGYVQMLQATSEIVSPAFSTVGFTNLTVDCLARTYGGGTASNIAVSISTDNGSTWAALGTVAPLDSTLRAMTTLSDTAHLGYEQTRIRWQSPDATGTVGVGVKTLVVQGWGPAYAPSFVAGYENLAVAGTSQAVTGLDELATYYFRVRAENAAGTSANSPAASVTTPSKANQTISFPAIGAQVATNVLALSATASSGLPVSFAVAGGPAEIDGAALTFTGAGTVSIVAAQAGDAAWNPAPSVTNAFEVSKAVAGVTLGSLAQAYDGTPKSATAVTVPAGLTVEFTYDGSPTAPSAEGSYAVTGTVNDAKYSGEASGTLVVSAEALTDFQLWVRDDQGQSLADPNFADTADYDGDGATTYDEYLADTDPASDASVLGLAGTYFNKAQAGGDTGEMRFTFPASTGRYYQLVYSTNLFGASNVVDLGWGQIGMAVTNDSPGSWFGAIRALLNAP